MENELESFIRKFKLLWQSGLEAHLDLNTHAGKARVGLCVSLGAYPVVKKTDDEEHRGQHDIQRRKLSPS